MQCLRDWLYRISKCSDRSIASYSCPRTACPISSKSILILYMFAPAGMANRRTPSWTGASWRFLLAALAAIAAAGVGAFGPNDDLNIAFNRQPLPVAGVPQSRISRRTAPEFVSPFRFLFVNQTTNRDPEKESYVVNELLPAAARILARSVRVRRTKTS